MGIKCNENDPEHPFNEGQNVPEDRYIVIKRSDLDDVQKRALDLMIAGFEVKQTSGVFVESSKFPDLADLIHRVLVHDKELRDYCNAVRIPLSALDEAQTAAILRTSRES